MATQIATVNGDLSDTTDLDFTNALVQARANTGSLVDPDNDKLRIFPLEDWKKVNSDGTWSLSGLVAAVDTAIPGTLQWYFDVKVIGAGVRTFGPYVLAAGVQNITDLDQVAPLSFNQAVDINNGVLSDAEDFTNAQMAAHIAAANPHIQYARFFDGSGALIPGAQILVQSAGSSFNPASIPNNTLVLRV